MARATRILTLLAVAVITAATASAQNPVTWTASTKTASVKPGETFKVEVVAQMDAGWHLYSIQQPPPPIATKITLPSGQPFSLSGTIQDPAPQVAFDQGFQMNTEFYAGTATFVLPVAAAKDAPAGKTVVKVQAYYQTCNDQFCLPPKRVNMEVPIQVGGGAAAAATTSPAPAASESASPKPAVTAPAAKNAGESKAKPVVPPPAATSPEATVPTTAAPSAEPTPAPPTTTPATSAAPASTRPATPPVPASPVPAQSGAASGSLLSFLWVAMTMGALSLLTPCVFPMVPITVSYFTNHAAGSRGKAVQQAVIYMLGIILTFTALGMALALVVGATSLNRFAANPWINILITAIFLGFAASLFGVFNLEIPPALVNRLDAITRKQGGSQTIATLLMGLTFTLTSFTCTAPFVGTLLVMAAGGNWQWPLVGMLAFSSVFALPFFVLALMPQWMAALPKAGGWLNAVKVMMAFLEVAAAMKFISNVDLVWGWHFFTRDVVLATWVVIALLMMLYIIGQFRFAHDAPVKSVGLVRLTTALACGTLAFWMMTGLFGKRLGELEAFLPPAPESMGIAAGGSSASSELPWIMNDYTQALARAHAEGRRVFIDFTGYTCTNCRWMEANMFTRQDVRQELGNYILVRLYTDGDGEVYEKQQALQQAKYQTVALPFYAVVEASGAPVSTFPGLTRNPEQFVTFLRQAHTPATSASLVPRP